MSDYFHCKLCDKPIKFKSKNKHSKSPHHQTLTNCIISRYCVTNPVFSNMEDMKKTCL